MKKLTTAFLGALIVSTCFIGCGNDDDDGNPGDGDAQNGDGDTPGGDGDTPGGDGDTPDTPVVDACSDVEIEVPDIAAGGASAGGAGGFGGSIMLTCSAPDAPLEDIAIAGEYSDDFGSDQSISNTAWNNVHLSLVDNEKGYALGRADQSDEWNACLWTKFEWVESEGDTYFCQSGFGSLSECEAEGAMGTDSTDLEEGCGGFSWSKLEAK